MPKQIPLTAINTAESIQIRAEIRSDIVEEYAELYLAKTKLPAIDVFRNGTGYLLADGFHRVAAAELAKLKELPAEIHTGGRGEAIKLGIAKNSSHGLRFTNEDKRRIVELALAEFPKLSARSIAEMCRVSHTFVEAQQKVSSSRQVATVATSTSASDSESSEQSEPPKVIGKDSKSYPSKKKTASAPSASASAGKEKTAVVRDKTGYPVPENCLELWNRGAEIRSLIASLGEINGAIMAAQGKGEYDILWRECDFSSLLGHVGQLRVHLRKAEPYAICATCQGLNRDNCKTCKQRGMVSQDFYERCVPVEIKAMRRKAYSTYA